MKRRKRTTTVTFETERVLIVGGSTGAHCDVCGGQATLVTLNEAARRSGVSERALYRGVEAGVIHSIEDKSGALFVCSKSIPLSDWKRA